MSKRLLALLFCVGCHDSAALDAKVPVGGLALHIHCEGSGSPAVVLDSGLGSDSRAWARVQPEVARFTKVCAYDRAGLGSSEPAPRPHSNRQMAEELHGLLAGAKVDAPYVLVGHSMGGTNVRLFLTGYSSTVAGMVLVDASPIPPPLADLPPEQVAEFERNIAKMEGLDLKTFLAGFEALSASEGALGDRPLVVLVAGRPPPEPFLTPQRAREVFEARQQAQHGVAALSANSVVLTVRESSHQIPLESPAVVVRAVKAVVESARSGAALTEASIR